MTKLIQKQTEESTVETLKSTGEWMRQEDFMDIHGLTNHQVNQAMSRLITEGSIVKRYASDCFAEYSINMMYFGSNVINSIWRKRK